MIILLFLFWVILNGKVTTEIVLVGAALSAALTCYAHRVLKVDPRKEALFWRRLPGIVLYLAYLVGQIVVSNLQVIRVILCPGKQHPKLVWFYPKTKTATGRLALANSITLTPGTVTVSLGDDLIGVYALRPEFAEGLEASGFVERLCRLEGEDHG